MQWSQNPKTTEVYRSLQSGDPTPQKFWLVCATGSLTSHLISDHTYLFQTETTMQRILGGAKVAALAEHFV